MKSEPIWKKYKGNNTFVVKVLNSSDETKDTLYITKEKDIIPSVKRRWAMAKGWSIDVYIVYDTTRTTFRYSVNF